MRHTFLVASIASLVACSSPSASPSSGGGAGGGSASGSGSSTGSGTSVAAPAATAPGCNPLIGDDCITPFPSSFYEVADATTETGFRVQIGSTGLPVQSNGIPLSAARLNQKDGFSPATPFVVYFAKGVDPTPLGNWVDPSTALTPNDPVQIIDAESGERVLAFAELDAQVTVGKQALIVRALKRLSPGHRYIIALVGLHDTSGAELTPAPFKALRDGTPLSTTLEPIAASYDAIFSVLASAGVDRSALTLAWDVVIASDSTATSHLLSMRDTAFAMIDAGQLGYQITNPGPTPSDPDLLAQVTAVIDVPQFLEDDSGVTPLNRDAQGNPVQNGTSTANVTINVPRCALTAVTPLPVVVFGHGIFGSAQSEMSESAFKQMGNDWCTIFIGTDWVGLSISDAGNLPTILGSDLNNFDIITDRLQQAHVNAQTMTRMFLTSMKNDPVLQVNGHPMTDARALYYLGVSLGGIEGTTFMGLSPDVTSGVLDVAGCEWSLLIQRSTDFGPFVGFLGGQLPYSVDQQVALASTQSEWDYADSATFAPHLLHSPFPGNPQKQILLQESLGDAEVANIATRVLARTAGLPSFDLTDPVPGVTSAPPPLVSGYTQFNSNPTSLPPLSNTALLADNGAHTSVIYSSDAQQQIHQFFSPGGEADDICGGTCSIP